MATKTKPPKKAKQTSTAKPRKAAVKAAERLVAAGAVDDFNRADVRDLRACNRCNAIREATVGVCACGSPEFRTIAEAQPPGTPVPCHVPAEQSRKDTLLLNLSREMVEHTDRLDKLQQDWDVKKTSALEAKHALKAEQDKGNELAREMRTVQRTGRSDRQPTLFDGQERAAATKGPPPTGIVHADGTVEKFTRFTKEQFDRLPLSASVNDHPIGQIGIEIPWIERLENGHKVKTIGDLRQRIASGRFSLDKATGFAAAARKEVFAKLETYLQEHGVEAFPADAGEESQVPPGTTFDGEVE